MAENTPATTPSPGEDEWPDRVTELLEATVTAVRTKTVVPLTTIAKIVAFALVLAAAGAALLLLLLIALIRLINVYLPVHPHARAVWITYAGLGAIFVVAGAFFLRKRPREKR